MEQGKPRSNGNGSKAPLPRAQKAGVLATDVGDEVVVYDSKEHRGHCLNPAAALVWRHLDGRTSMDDMVTLLKELDARADRDTVWLALKELDRAHLLEQPLARPVPDNVSRRSMLRRLSIAAGGGAVLLPAISTMIAPPAYAQASPVACATPEPNCATFSCPGGCACVPTTEGTNVCIVPSCVAPCTTSADCPPGSVCFTLGCCGPATFCVPIAPAGTNCGGPVSGTAWTKAQ